MLSFTVVYEHCITCNINIFVFLAFWANQTVDCNDCRTFLKSEAKVNEGSQSVHSPVISKLCVFNIGR